MKISQTQTHAHAHAHAHSNAALYPTTTHTYQSTHMLAGWAQPSPKECPTLGSSARTCLWYVPVLPPTACNTCPSDSPRPQVSKIPGGLNESAARAQLELSVDQLFPGAADSYVDLMLVHFPASWGGVGGKAMRQAGWRALETFQRAGRTRAIGVSHFCRKHLDDILEIATINPAVNQVDSPAMGS